ncbi:hypothetical protein PNA2_1146 [Pyrococcus sp. NA2]|uniref:hypothetical protein n=1 Tax=Pyrococcus sp. (strain NA2) TaxID=342949 RepID=UPI000209AB6A|nr:hypothetical protein [Pyrococcus sp. NA2]AEC52062.1 hypothetical protein PNA2_1146 [Pyrococcus sp. NA2]
MPCPSVEEVKELVVKIRKEHGLPLTPFEVDEVRCDEGKVFIIAHDRADKSVIIGSSLVIGKLRETIEADLVSVYTTLDLLLKRSQLEKSLEFAEEHGLNFLIPIIRAEMKFPPRKWPKISTNSTALVFLTFNAQALLGFTRSFGLRGLNYGIRYSFPKLDYIPLDRPLRELFFPNQEFLKELALENNVDIVISEFKFPAKADEVVMINPMRFLRIGYFETKYLFGESRPTIFNKLDLIEYVIELVGEGLMEATDGARIIRWGWKR